MKETLQSVSNDDVFVLGDCAKIEDMALPCTAQVAMQQANIVAKNIMAKTLKGEDSSLREVQILTSGRDVDARCQ